MNTPKSVIKKIQSKYLAFQKMKGYTNLEIYHDVVSLYNPVQKMYCVWDVSKPCYWIIKLGKNGEITKRYMIYEYYSNIDKIMCEIQYGK